MPKLEKNIKPSFMPTFNIQDSEINSWGTLELYSTAEKTYFLPEKLALWWTLTVKVSGI